MKNNIKVIALVGIAGSGKSTAARIITGEERNKGRLSQVISFAGGVKQGLLDAFPEFFSYEDFHTQEGKLEKNKHLGVTNRHILQQFGTEFARSIHPDFWVNLLKIRYLSVEQHYPTTYIIDDCRFLNEINMVHGFGGRVVFIERDVLVADYKENPPETDHESERCYLYHVDGYSDLISNTGDVEHLKQEIANLKL